MRPLEPSRSLRETALTRSVQPESFEHRTHSRYIHQCVTSRQYLRGKSVVSRLALSGFVFHARNRREFIGNKLGIIAYRNFPLFLAENYSSH